MSNLVRKINKSVRWIRTIIFEVLFACCGTMIILFIMTPVSLLGRTAFRETARSLWTFMFWLHKVAIGTTHEIRNLENIPSSSCIIAARHESQWETMKIGTVLSHPVLILKSELMRIPLVGFLLRNLHCIPVDRKKGTRALKQVGEAIIAAAKNDRVQVVIFPHGTRIEPDDFTTPIKRGVVTLYEQSGLPVVPVAITTSGAWPRFPKAAERGPMIIKFFPPIPPGLPRQELLANLNAVLNDEARKLRNEALERMR